MAKRFKKIVELNWEDAFGATIIWSVMFSLFHYLMLWFSDIKWKLISLGIIIGFAIFGIILARLTAKVYYEEIK